jgi:putative oligomerization/nucleic acid binding protein
VVRLQLRWFTFACASVLVSFVFEILSRFDPIFNGAANVSSEIAVTLIPTATGIAILRYRLYEIDIIINRTLVYAALTAVLAGVYTAAVAFFQRLFVAVTGESSDVAIVLTLFVLATVFTPLKNALQANADRLLRSGVATGPTSAAIDDLVRLAELHARGILTDEEFAAKKRQVLGIATPHLNDVDAVDAKP